MQAPAIARELQIRGAPVVLARHAAHVAGGFELVDDARHGARVVRELAADVRGRACQSFGEQHDDERLRRVEAERLELAVELAGERLPRAPDQRAERIAASERAQLVHRHERRFDCLGNHCCGNRIARRRRASTAARCQ